MQINWLVAGAGAGERGVGMQLTGTPCSAASGGNGEKSPFSAGIASGASPPLAVEQALPLTTIEGYREESSPLLRCSKGRRVAKTQLEDAQNDATLDDDPTLAKSSCTKSFRLTKATDAARAGEGDDIWYQRFLTPEAPAKAKRPVTAVRFHHECQQNCAITSAVYMRVNHGPMDIDIG